MICAAQVHTLAELEQLQRVWCQRFATAGLLGLYRKPGGEWCAHYFSRDNGLIKGFGPSIKQALVDLENRLTVAAAVEAAG